ncbi:unnamed protein product [Brassica oleracea var. botrytis]|uniref:Uncharacterized protein n=1 Tax=Brassica oleracea TaxID=3712 RepID=A0A3P6BP05_BRAOL|nr:unnamed protein product [Brassica oleracea]
MTSESIEDAEAVLSDVEIDEPSPVALNDPPREDVRDERVTELIAELDREKKAREAAESSKSDLQASFNRLKALAHEESLSKELESVSKGKDEMKLKLDEVVRDRDALKGEIEKVSGKVRSFKSFTTLPKSQKYTGLASVAYGVIKPANEIVEDLVREIDKSRNEAREQVDQRNYEIAIEVSQLESTISNLRLEVAEKASFVDDLERDVSEKDKRIGELEKDKLEKGCNPSPTVKMVAQRPLLVEQLNLVSKIHDQLYEVVRIVDVNSSEELDLSESFFMPQETEMEENVRASLAGMESIFELTKVVSGKTQSLVEEKSHEVKNLNETVGLLVKEKEHIGTLLRSALSKRMITEQPSQKSELFQAAENGLRDVGVDFKPTKPLKDENVQDTRDINTVDNSTEENEIYSLASTLENIVKASQVKIVELQHSEETSSLKKQLDSQTKELHQRMRQIEELKEKERIANENVEGLMTDIAAAEEEIARWKVAAEVQIQYWAEIKDLINQLHVLKEELEEAKHAIKESEKKLKFKEETAAAAMGAREAAERSLKLADNRATRLRERMQELNRKVEDLETHRDTNSSNRARYVCWPW